MTDLLYEKIEIGQAFDHPIGRTLASCVRTGLMMKKKQS
jgi:hypothetical protein